MGFFHLWHEFSPYFVKIVKLNEFKDFLPMNLAYRTEVHWQVLLLNSAFEKQLLFYIKGVKISVITVLTNLFSDF